MGGGTRSSRGQPSVLEQIQKVLSLNSPFSFGWLLIENPLGVRNVIALYLVVNNSLPEIVPRLMTRFSSSEGYKLFDDTLPVRMYSIYVSSSLPYRPNFDSASAKGNEHTVGTCEQYRFPNA